MNTVKCRKCGHEPNTPDLIHEYEENCGPVFKHECEVCGNIFDVNAYVEYYFKNEDEM